MVSWTYCATSIANFFLSKKDHGINNLKLNHLVYISFGYALAGLGREIFTEEIIARKYGPVIPSIYHCFKEYRRAVISTKAFFYEDFAEGGKLYNTVAENDIDLLNLLENIWEVYGKLTAWELVELSRKRGSPLKETYINLYTHATIPKETIKKYYDKLCSN